ncbi:MAG: ParB/RepB/Spo0J family partition protein [Janthinobacterium lividum]
MSDTAIRPPFMIATGSAKAAVKAAAGKSADLWMIPPGRLHFDPLDNVRPLNAERVQHLAGLIRDHGFDKSQPLSCIVKRIEGEDLIFVISGQHRYHGALMAIQNGAAIDAIPCVIRKAKCVNRRALIISGVTNNDSERLTPLELAGAIQALVVEGMTSTEIAQQLHITEQTIRDLHLLSDAPVELQEMIAAGQVAATLAIQEIRTVGFDKAIERLRRALATSKERGKTRITRKDVLKVGSGDSKPAKDNAVVTDPSDDISPGADLSSSPPTVDDAPSQKKKCHQIVSDALLRVIQDPAFFLLSTDAQKSVERGFGHLMHLRKARD